MKTIIILSDIHSNLPALISVLSNIEVSEIKDIEIVICGDVISFGPEPVECLELLQQLHQIKYVLGNNDRYVVDKVFKSSEPFHTDLEVKLPQEYLINLEWTYNQLDEEYINFIKGWPKSVVVSSGNQKICVSHGVPWDDEKCLHTDISESYLKDKLSDFDCYVSGHNHIPMIRESLGRLYLNAGSVGIPLDGNTDACYLKISNVNNMLRPVICRVKYDLKATLNELKRKDVPWANQIASVLKKAAL